MFDHIDWHEAQRHNHHYGYDVDEFKIYSIIRHITFGSNYYIIHCIEYNDYEFLQYMIAELLTRTKTKTTEACPWM